MKARDLHAGRQVERHRFFRRGRADAAFQHHRLRVEPACAQVVAEAGQLRGRFDDALGDEGAGTLTLHQQAIAHQAGDRLAHGDPREVHQRGEFALRRQCLADAEHAVFDRMLQRAPQVLVGRRAMRIGLAAEFGKQVAVHGERIPIKYQMAISDRKIQSVLPNWYLSSAVPVIPALPGMTSHNTGPGRSPG